VRTPLSIPFALRSAAVLAALLAAWGPRMPGSEVARHVVLVDVSASSDTAALWQSLVPAESDVADATVLTFGDGVVAVDGGEVLAPDRWRRAVSRGPTASGTASDLAAALRAAAELGDGASPLDVTVAGDGSTTSTSHELERAAQVLRRAGCVRLRFVTTPPRELGPRVTAVRGPGRVRRGSAFGVVVDGFADPGGGRLELLRDGAVAAARDVPEGPFRTVFPQQAGELGERIYGARLTGEADRPGPRAHVLVAERGRGLLLSDGEPGPALDAAVGVALDRFAGDARDLVREGSSRDVVVVDGPLAPHLQQVLADGARDGWGVLLLGGPGSVVDSGGALADVAPLRAAPPDDPGAFLYVAIDGSGSMAERWPGGERTRDDVVRAAVAAMTVELPQDVTVALRRFDDRLRPVGAPPWTGRPASDGAAIRAAIDGWGEPGGGTALAPVLDEAAQLAAARGERARRALVFTDGRFADDAADVAAAIRRLAGAGCELAIVVDGTEALARVEAAVAAAAVRPSPHVVHVGHASTLTTAFRRVAAPRPGAVLRDPIVALTAAGAEVPGLAAPETVASMARRWPAADAVVWVRTEDGAPLAAVRRHGEGRIAAIATRPVDPSRMADGEKARALLGALRAWAQRRPDGDVRVQRDGDRLLVRASGVAPTHAEVRVASSVVRLPLRTAEGGLLEATLPAGVDGGLVRLLAEGAEIWGAGLDRPAVPEIDRGWQRSPSSSSWLRMRRRRGAGQVDRGSSRSSGLGRR
jgi:hypothetical protein